MVLNFKKLHPNAQAPKSSYNWDAGYDLHACENVSIEPMGRTVVPIGISIEIPHGYYGRIAPRSGLAVKKGIDVLAGVIDSSYRDEIKVVLINLNLPEALFLDKRDKRSHTYNNLFGSKLRHDIIQGDRVAQLIIEKCHHVTWREEEELNEFDRKGGFGSTGN